MSHAPTQANTYNRSLLEANLDALVAIGPDGKITDVNAATETVTGRCRDELIGSDFLNYFTEPEQARTGYQRVFEKGFVRDYPLEIRHRDGHTIPVMYNATVYRDESGNVVGVLADARDISERIRTETALNEANNALERRVAERTAQLANTNAELLKEIAERKRAEEDIRTSEAKYRSLFENMAEGFALYELLRDAQGHPIDWRVLEINDAYTHHTGIERQSIVGRSVGELYPDAVPEYLPLFTHVVESRQSVDFEMFSKFVGRYFHVVSFPAGGDRFASIIENISERKQAQMERDNTIRLLRLINASKSSRELLTATVQFVKETSGCDAVGIRLKHDGDFPYAETLGFSKEFLAEEQSLCGCGKVGGNTTLACLCGKVIRGNQTPSGLTFTEHGTFWCNDASALLQIPFDTRDAIRGRCIREGYDSIGLLPLYEGAERIGLLQLNYRKKEAFSQENLAFWERLANLLAVAVAKIQSEEELRKMAAKLQAVNISLNDSRRAAIDLMEDAIEARRQTEQALASLRQSEELNRQTLQALPAHVAVLDQAGRILSVNEAWENFARANASSGSAAVTVGANYLDACRQAAADNDAEAAQALSGIEEVLNGKRARYELEYACHSPQQQRWFLMSVTPLGGSGKSGAVISHFNITDRKQAEEALRTSEEQLRLVLQASLMGTFDVDLVSGETRWNEQEFGLLGLNPGQEPACPETFFRYVHPEDGAALREKWKAASTCGKLDAEFRIIRADGKMRWLAVKGQLIDTNQTAESVPDNPKQGLRFMGVNFDITAHRLAIEALRKSELRFRSIFDHAATGIAITDCTGLFIQSNAAYRRLIGYSSSELSHMEFQTLLHPPDRERNMAFIRQLLEGAIPSFEIENNYVHKNGNLVSVHKYVSVLRDNRGQPTHIIALVSDITQRKKTEDVLRFLGQCDARSSGQAFFPELARYLAHVLNMDYVCIDRLEEGQLSAQTLAVFHNGTFQNNMSYTLKDTPCGAVVGQRICCYPRNVRDLFAKDLVLQELQAESYLGTTLWSAQGKPIGLIAVIGRKPLEDARLAEGILQLVAVRAAGELERQQAEQAITQLNTELEQRVRARTSELAATNLELEAFCYSVSHDLRAPLRSMDGFSQALLEDYGPQLDGAGQDFLHRIRSSSQRMARLIDDLLNLSRLTRSQMRCQPVNLSALAQSAVADLRQAEPDRTVEVRIAPDLVVSGDPVLLRAALSNLLQNAWKFTAKNPAAVIEVGQTDIAPPPVLTPPSSLLSPLSSPPPSPAFFVRDNGVGFDMQYADKLFTPFQRLHAMTDFPGSGIGLATVQRVIHRHNGRVWFTSAPGQGATFYFTIGAPT